MIDNLFDILYSALYQNIWIAFAAAFGWGILSIILSPCHLTSIPLVIGFLSSGDAGRKRAFSLSLIFAFGILITIGLIGLITASMGRIMGDIGKTGNYFVAAVFFLIGLYLLDIINLPIPTLQIGNTKSKGYAAALILGLLFGIGLGPCTFAFMAPIPGVVFDLSSTDIISAIMLLLFFALGHCTVIALAGGLSGLVQKFLSWNETSNAVKWVRRVCGVLVILGGVYLVYNTI
jgi:cytochrome c-type biogenesis protein